MARTPDNEFVRMIERTAQLNAQMGGGGAASADPRPSAASSALGREVVEQEPLTMEERHELDRKAVELGILPPEAIGITTVGEGEYATQEEALAAAGIDINAMDVAAPTADPTLVPRRTPRMTTRMPAMPAQMRIIETPRFPDFTKVQGIDLVQGEAFLDGMAFKIPAEALRRMRQFVVELARADVMRRLTEAANLFAPEGSNGNEAVQQVQAGKVARGVQS